MRERILIVDDEQEYRELIGLFLRSEGLDIVEAANGRQALEAFRSHPPDLVILDIMLPDISGFEVCKEIRRTSDVPILLLTALEDEEYHIVGYRAGADDYVAKPFKSAVLALKVKRILERTKGAVRSVITASGILLDEDAYTCTIDGAETVLTPKEFALLTEFMRNQGRVLTREYLLRRVWGFDYEGETRAVDTLVKKLRKKMGPASALIKTIISVGYKMEENL